MARYFFHLFNSLETRDEEGRHLYDVNAARWHAVTEARHLMAADVKDRGELNLTHRIEVVEETGVTVAVVRFDEAVKIIA